MSENSVEENGKNSRVFQRCISDNDTRQSLRTQCQLSKLYMQCLITDGINSELWG